MSCTGQCIGQKGPPNEKVFLDQVVIKCPDLESAVIFWYLVPLSYNKRFKAGLHRKKARKMKTQNLFCDVTNNITKNCENL